ncbi:MAG: hypothetical protein HY703_08575 [Gemmatimonadetes bacterium]|nr:hypothetical protein [Gemmatimonadota bacterium]
MSLHAQTPPAVPGDTLFELSLGDGSTIIAHVTFLDVPLLILSGGIRFFGERLSADVGLATLSSGGEGFCCAPVVNFVYNLGGTRR